MTDDGLVTITEAARLVGRSRGTVLNWIVRGHLAVKREGLVNRAWVKLVDPGEVRQLAAWRHDVQEEAVRVRLDRNTRASRGGPTAAELDTLIAVQTARLPSWWWQDCARMAGRRHKVEVPEQSLPNWSGVSPVLHPNTAPDRIARTHCALVADYMAAHPNATAAEVSEAVVLPVWNVERAIEVLQSNIGKEAA